jgi:hypothetical protein
MKQRTPRFPVNDQGGDGFVGLAPVAKSSPNDQEEGT